MTKLEVGQVTVTATGPIYLVLNDQTLTPGRVVLFVNSSSTEAAAGYHDSGVDFTGSNAYGDTNAAHTITHYRNISGTKTKTLEGIVTATYTGEIDLSITTLSQTTVLRYVVIGT